MRILLLDWTLPKLLKDSDSIAGGAASEWYSWIKGIRGNKHEFILLTFKGASDFIAKKLDFEIAESYNDKKSLPILGWLYYKFPSLFFAIKKAKPDVIITMCATNFVGVLPIIGKILDIPFAFRVANDPDVDGRKKAIMGSASYYFYRFGLKITKYILAQNSYQYERMKRDFPDKYIINLPVPYSMENYRLPSSQNEREYVAWVANFRYQKNLKALFDVATSLPNINFHIAGLAQPNIDDETAKAVEELKKMKNVKFVGYIPRSGMHNFYRKALLLLNTSRWEGFSNAFLEAWAAGVPVVTTQNVNPDNLIPRFGLGVVAENYTDLPNKILEMINHPEYTDFIFRTHNYVKENHDPIKLTNVLIDFLTKNK